MLREGIPDFLLVPDEFYRPGMVAFLVKGSCMDPEVPSGSFVLVDTCGAPLEEGGIYVLSAAGEKFVKRAVRRGRGWAFEPDNKDEPHPSFFLEEVEVLGRVYGVMLWDRLSMAGREEEAEA